MIAPLECCEYARDIYDPVPVGRFDWVREVSGIVVGYNVAENVLAFRGSQTAEDWIRNFIAIPAWDDDIGFCEAGFLIGVDDVVSAVRGDIKPGVVLPAHSLGGAHARLVAAKLIKSGFDVAQLCTFGSPKAGFINHARILQKSGMAHTSYRNRNDVVPTVPLTIEPCFAYVHPEAWTALNSAPATDNLEPLRDHAIDLYQKGLLP